MATCRGCGAAIRFVTIVGSGKVMPIDPIATPDGNVAGWQSGGRWLGQVLTADNRAHHASLKRRLYVAHWKTCPDFQPKQPPPPKPQESLF